MSPVLSSVELHFPAIVPAVLTRRYPTCENVISPQCIRMSGTYRFADTEAMLPEKMTDKVQKNLEASIEIAAPPEQVWAIVSDVQRMSEFSPNTVRMIPIGAPRVGSWTININRSGIKFWPTTARILRYEPNNAVAFRITENRTVWSYTLEPTEDGGTRLTERRDTPNGVSWLSRTATDAALGGRQSFDEELVRGMNDTLRQIKTEVEKGS